MVGEDAGYSFYAFESVLACFVPNDVVNLRECSMWRQEKSVSRGFGMESSIDVC